MNNASADNTPIPAEEEIIDLRQYWRIIKRAKWSIAAITLPGLIIGGLNPSSPPPISVP